MSDRYRNDSSHPPQLPHYPPESSYDYYRSVDEQDRQSHHHFEREAGFASPDDIFPGHPYPKYPTNDLEDQWGSGGNQYSPSSSKRKENENVNISDRHPPSKKNKKVPKASTSKSPEKRDDQDDDDDEEETGTPRSKGKNKEEPKQAKRAAQACLRCRKQKLRCIGGWPCKRCEKANHNCDFGPNTGTLPTDWKGSLTDKSGRNSKGHELDDDLRDQLRAGAEANARLQQLESSVASLLAGLAGNGGGSGDTGAIPTSQLQSIMSGTMGSFSEQGGPNSDNHRLSYDGMISDRRNLSFSSNDGNMGGGNRPTLPPLSNSTSLPSWQTNLPPPITNRPAPLQIPPQSANGRLDQLPSISPELSAHQPQQSSHSVRFSTSPHVTFAYPTFKSPSNHTSSGISPASGLSGGGSEKREKKLGKGQKAEERLAAATDGGFEPPFKALVYQPAVWDNREQSRRNSPQPSADTASRDELSSHSYGRRFGYEKDDPVNTGLIDISMAQALFTFFVEHIHPFCPVVNVALQDSFTTIRQSPFLISAILAISARFYIRYTTRYQRYSTPVRLDSGIPSQLANLAETHLGLTLLRKQHALSDVQAVLLMAAWGLEAGGKGPDAWIVTGHAARLARRLGVHKVLAKATENVKASESGSEEWTKLEAFLPQWRTWLAWFCFDGLLSLGFGRPQSTQFETVDEEGFLQLRLSQSLPRPGSTASTSLYGDVLVAGQVQLTQIGRDLINWGEQLANPASVPSGSLKREGDVKGNVKGDLRSMFTELNGKLDEWSKLWVWPGSPYTLYLGSSARIARLQADHMRLCLNSFALGAKPDEDELVGECLKKALNAAMSTIQTHFESSQTDMALSFATDYITITLAQAAVFLIRITKAPPAVQAVVNLDSSVASHYLTMSVDLLENADMSETRLSTFLAKTIREIARAAGISGMTPPPSRMGLMDSDQNNQSQNNMSLMNGLISETGNNGFDGQSTDAPMVNQSSMTNNMNGENGMNGEVQFDLENFLQLESQIDLSYLLGLPGDSNNNLISPFVNGNSMNGQQMVGQNGMSGDIDPNLQSSSGGGNQAWGMNNTGNGGNWNMNNMGEFQSGVGMSGFGLGWMGLGDNGNNNGGPGV